MYICATVAIEVKLIQYCLGLRYTNGRSAKPCNQQTLGQAVLPITDSNHQVVIPAIIPATIPDAGHPAVAPPIGETTSLTDSRLLGLEGLRQSTGTERRAFGREHAAVETGASWSVGQSWSRSVLRLVASSHNFGFGRPLSPRDPPLRSLLPLLLLAKCPAIRPAWLHPLRVGPFGTLFQHFRFAAAFSSSSCVFCPAHVLFRLHTA